LSVSNETIQLTTGSLPVFDLGQIFKLYFDGSKEWDVAFEVSSEAHYLPYVSAHRKESGKG